MKLFFISDIHGSLDDLRWALDCFEQEQADRILILGDVLYHGPRNKLPEGYSPAAVADLLNLYKDRINAVRGNCDSEVDQMLIAYPMMETYSTVQLESRQIFLSHGHIYGPGKLPNLRAGDIFASGHTHLPRAELVDGIYEFNPGSISLPKQGNPKSYGIFDGDLLQVKTQTGAVVCEVAVS